MVVESSRPDRFCILFGDCDSGGRTLNDRARVSRPRRGRRPITLLVAAVLLGGTAGTAASSAPASEPQDDLAAPSVSGGRSDLPDWFEENRVQGHPDSFLSPYQMLGHPAFERTGEGNAALGGNAFTRMVITRDEDPWWGSDVPVDPATGERLFNHDDDLETDADRTNVTQTQSATYETFLPAGTNLAQDMVDEATENDQKMIAYYWAMSDRTVQELHPEWICRNINGVAEELPRGVLLDITSGYREIVRQRLLELAEMGVAGFYFDFFHMPRNGCFDAPFEQAFKDATGLEVPTTLSEQNPIYRAWLDFKDQKVNETFAYWKSEVQQLYPDVVFIVSGTFLSGLTDRRMSTELARVADSVKTEYENAVQPGLAHSVFKNNPDLAEPENWVRKSLGFTLLRDSSGAPPHVWETGMPNVDQTLLYVSSILAHGGVAAMHTNARDLLLDDPPTPNEDLTWYTDRESLEAAFDLGTQVSPYLARTNAVRFAAVHYGESSRNTRKADYRAAWEEVLWPMVGAYSTFVREGVPVGTVDDYQLAAGDLEGYELLFLSNRGELTEGQATSVAAFEASGGVVIENDTSWAWSDPDQTDAAAAAFLAEVEPYLEGASVNVSGGPDRLYAGAFELPGTTATDKKDKSNGGEMAETGGRLVVAVTNDFDDVQTASTKQFQDGGWDDTEIQPAPPAASGVVVEWDRELGFTGAAGNGEPIRVFDAVSGQALVPEPTTDGYRVELPDFDHMAVLVVEFDPSSGSTYYPRATGR